MPLYYSTKKVSKLPLVHTFKLLGLACLLYRMCNVVSLLHDALRYED